MINRFKNFRAFYCAGHRFYSICKLWQTSRVDSMNFWLGPSSEPKVEGVKAQTLWLRSRRLGFSLIFVLFKTMRVDWWPEPGVLQNWCGFKHPTIYVSTKWPHKIGFGRRMIHRETNWFISFILFRLFSFFPLILFYHFIFHTDFFRN